MILPNGKSITQCKLTHGAQRGPQNGTVIVLVLWVLLALSLLALSFASAVRTEVNASRNIVDQQQAYYLARAGIDYAVYKILEVQSNSVVPLRTQLEEGGPEAVPEVFKGTLNLELEGGSVEIQVAPETGKINLNGNDDLLIFNLLVMIGLSEAEAEVITDSIMDWKDPDDDPRPNGAESSYYESLPEPYRAKNSGSFSVPEELLLVRGVTPEIYYGRKGVTQDGQRADFFGLQNYFTTFGTGGKIDVNTAPVQVLAAIPGLDYEDALNIVDMRPLTDLADVMNRILGPDRAQLLNYLTVSRSSFVYSLDATARLGDNRAASRIRCVVQVGDPNNPKQVLYWNEANIEL